MRLLVWLLTLTALPVLLVQPQEIVLQNAASAVLYPNIFTTKEVPPRKSVAVNAIDGENNIGFSGTGNGILNCASTADNRVWRKLQYLRINLQRVDFIAAVRLHLRDGLNRQKWQNGLSVRVSNTTDLNSAHQCGSNLYNADRDGQSPVFVCLKSATFIWAVVSRRNIPVQVCEVQAFNDLPKMDLTGLGVASLSTDSVYEWRGNIASADKAVDGNSNLGSSGGNGGHNCAVIILEGPRSVTFLRIALGHGQRIHYIRLHLRDERKRYKYQNGLIVAIGDSANVAVPRQQCGSVYNETQGQSPVFRCGGVGQYVWAVLDSEARLQICEVEVYADIKCLQPESPSNGVYSATTLSYGGRLSLLCDSGYVATSTDPVTCERSGNWSRVLPTCQQLECPTPPTIANGKRQLSGLAVDSKATYSCNPGYKLSNQGKTLTRTCVRSAESSNLEWNGSEPECIHDEDYCKYGTPGNGTGVPITDNSKVTTGVTYSCNTGYVLIGDKVLHCMNGSFTGKVPQCNAVKCESPPTPDNGKYSGDGFSYGQTVKYRCSSGYRLATGSASAICQANGKWNITSAPSCQPYCVHPGGLVNGQIKQKSSDKEHINVGSSVVYLCNDGYELPDSSNRTRTCLANRSLSGSALECSRVSCGVPSSPVTGTFVTTTGNFKYESLVTFECNEGYYPKGAKVARCLATKRWNATAPLCVPYCDPLPRIPYGNIVEGDDRLRFDVGTTVKYKCINGYEMANITHKLRTCLSSKLWSGTAPSCKPVDCGPPRSPENGHRMLLAGTTTYLSKVNFSCVSGHHLVGADSARCDATGLWSSSTPRCRPYCLHLGLIANGQVVLVSTKRVQLFVGAIMEYICDVGYELSTEKDKRRTCQGNRTWSGSAPSCQLVDCGRPERPDNGDYVLTTTETTYLSEVTFSCSSEHYLKGEESAQCEATGSWSDDAPICKPYCERPPSVLNGIVHGIDDVDYIDVDAIVTYVCDKGYEISDIKKTRRTCLPRRRWSGTAPTCKPVDCRNPVTSVNGGFRGKTTYKSIVNFFCHDGYYAGVAKSALCQADKQWSARGPSCTPYCTKPPNPIHGQVTLHWSVLVQKRIATNTEITYTCDKSYIWVGAANVRRCIGPLTWSGKAPTCQKGNCGITPDPVKGTCTETHTTEDGIRTCSCLLGYKLDDPSLATSTCVIKKNVALWDRRRPSCKRIICPDLNGTASPHVILTFTGKYLNDIASYKCEPGYMRTTGDMKRTCTRDDIWTGTALQCEIRKCRALKSPSNGVLIGESRTYGSKVTYSCNAGYKLKYGVGKRTCLAVATWSGTEPICQHACTTDQRNPTTECRINGKGNNVWSCLERSQCPSDFSPVCGTDGVTYNSKCLLKVVSCQDGKRNVSIAARGQCQYGGVCSEQQPRPANGVTCRAFLYRYWFNATSGKCERYVYGGCYEGRNSFYTEQDCQTTCIETNVCKLPFEAGLCNFKQEKRYFFNSSSQRCESFFYGGCFGNENNFRTEGICSKRCCVCTSLTSRKQANKNRDAVVLFRVTSTRTERGGKVAYRAKIQGICKTKSVRSKSLSFGDIAWLTVTERPDKEQCLCPRLSKGETYRIGVDVTAKSGKIWELLVPRDFYVKEATTCQN